MSIQTKSESCPNCGHGPKQGLQCEVCKAIKGWYPFEIVVLLSTLMTMFVICLIGVGVVVIMDSLARETARAQAQAQETQTAMINATATIVAIPTATYQAEQTRQVNEATQQAIDANKVIAERAEAEAQQEAEARSRAEAEATRIVVVSTATAEAIKACDPAGFMVYHVKETNWLSKIADTLYDDAIAYDLIVQATNNAHEIDSTFLKVDDPNQLEIGDKLCVPLRTAEELELE